jgi:hypothetical protein
MVGVLEVTAFSKLEGKNPIPFGALPPQRFVCTSFTYAIISQGNQDEKCYEIETTIFLHPTKTCN